MGTNMYSIRTVDAKRTNTYYMAAEVNFVNFLIIFFARMDDIDMWGSYSIANLWFCTPEKELFVLMVEYEQ